METININPIALRVAELIENKTGGSRVLFARQVGWSKQRLTNVLAGACGRQFESAHPDKSNRR